MRQFIYKPEHVGLTEWPSGTLRLEGIHVTDDPEEADVFVCPGSLALFRNPEDLKKLPYFKGRESIHCFFDVSDHETQYHQPSMFIRCNLRPFNLEADPNSIQMAWPVEDYAECLQVPECGFTNHISFHGWATSHPSRELSIQSCLDSGVKCSFSLYNDFTGYLKADDPELARRRVEFRRSMRESKICLCPESIPGVFPYRYFEAMSAGRIPLLVGSDFVFPFNDEIDYKAFTVFCSRADAAKAGEIAEQFLSSHSDADVIEMGRLARQAWVWWLDGRNWPSLHAYAVQKTLGVLQAA